MPKIYRSMLVDGGKPKVGDQAKMLGVRVAPTPHPDISVDVAGNVPPGTGGMSVASHWRTLPVFLIPKRLKHIIPRACGSNRLVCWATGTGPFELGGVTNDLEFRPDPDKPSTHGFVEPSHEMSIDRYQSSLADTQEQWIKDEG